jgi:hypothetical protein
VFTYKQVVVKLARSEIVPQAEIAETLKATGQTREQMDRHLEQQRRVDELNRQIEGLRQFFAKGPALSDEIEKGQKALQEANEAYAAWVQEVREHGESKKAQLLAMEADLHLLWARLVTDLHEAGRK